MNSERSGSKFCAARVICLGSEGLTKVASLVMGEQAATRAAGTVEEVHSKAAPISAGMPRSSRAGMPLGDHPKAGLRFAKDPWKRARAPPPGTRGLCNTAKRKHAMQNIVRGNDNAVTCHSRTARGKACEFEEEVNNEQKISIHWMARVRPQVQDLASQGLMFLRCRGPAMGWTSLSGGCGAPRQERRGVVENLNEFEDGATAGQMSPRGIQRSLQTAEMQCQAMPKHVSFYTVRGAKPVYRMLQILLEKDHASLRRRSPSNVIACMSPMLAWVVYNCRAAATIFHFSVHIESLRESAAIWSAHIQRLTGTAQSYMRCTERGSHGLYESSTCRAQVEA